MPERFTKILSDRAPDVNGGAAEPYPHVLVLDDQQIVRKLLFDALTAKHYRVSLAESIEEAELLLASDDFDAVMVDIFLEDQDLGLSLLPRIRELQPDTPTIVISGQASKEHIIKALKDGAYDIIVKPFKVIDALHAVARAVEKKRLAEENKRLLAALREERDRLEERVGAATQDLQKSVETLRLINEQVATMFEMSQMPAETRSSEEVARHIFNLLRRMIDFSGAFCVVYDIRAKSINMAYFDGEQAQDFCAQMDGLFRVHGEALAELAESQERLPVSAVQTAIRQLYPAPWSDEDTMLMPLHVHQTLMGVVGLIHTRKPSQLTHLTQAEERILAIAISHFLAAIEKRSFMTRTSQLVGLGELVSEIAHDLRHPMTALHGAAHILIGGWQDESRRTRCLEEIQSNLGRMESLVSELVNFYNPKEMNMVSVDTHALLNKALKVSHAILEQKEIQVDLRYEEGPVMILGLTRNLIEAFINLITNACHAMEMGGELVVETIAHLEGEHYERLRELGRQPTSYIAVKVRDNGCGIPEENRDRIFHRFFTTRPEGHGLGLPAVKRIVKKNLGHIHWESQVGQGTTFYLYLPKA